MKPKSFQRVTRSNYQTPYRPWPIHFMNLLGRALPHRPLQVDSLMHQAQRKFQQNDFGEPTLAKPLDIMLQSIEQEAQLHPVGHWITRQRLLNVLGNRLRAQYWFSHHPEILSQTIGPLVIITGLQRTGTTLLHRLMAADPKTRTLTSWEALNPAPLILKRPEPIDPRKKLAKTSEKALAYLAPDFFAIHPVEAEAPEEDSLLLDFSFLSPVAEATLQIPSYSRWLKQQTMLPAYQLLSRLLKLLQWQRPANRWVLKSPAHLPFLKTLLDVFPQATIVHTHRDPLQTIASYCSMIAHGRGVFSDCIVPDDLGRELIKQQSEMLDTAIEIRKNHPRIHERIIDIHYPDLLKDPILQIRRIYTHVGFPFDSHNQKRLENTLQHNRQHRFGIHRYDLDDFGLSPSQVKSSFVNYYNTLDRIASPHKE